MDSLNKHRALLLDLLPDTCFFLFICSIALVACEMLGGTIYMYGCYLMYIPFLICLFLRKYKRSFIIFILAHVAIMAVILILPINIFVKSSYVAFFFIICIHSFVRRLGKEETSFSLAFIDICAVLNIIIQLIISYRHIGVNTNLFVINMFISIALYLLYNHISNINGYLEHTEDLEQENIIKKFNNKMILVFLAILTFFAFITRFLGLDILLGKTFKLIGSGILALIRLIFSNQKGNVKPPNANNIIDKSSSSSPFFLKVPSKPHPFLDLLENIFMDAIIILLIVAVIIGVIYFIYKMYKKFHQTEYNTGRDVKEFVLDKSIFSGISSLFHFNSGGAHFENTLNGKVRKAFYKKISLHIKKGVDIDIKSSPKQMGTAVSSVEDISKLEELYEVARYSNKTITETESKSIK